MPQDEKILIIDDDPASLYAKVLDLTAQGYSVVQASTGEQGIRLAEETSPDLILLDYQVPFLNGFETLKQLYANYHTRAIPVIFVTGAYDDPEYIEQALSLGADEYLTKPISTKELLAHIKSILKIGRARKELEQVKSDFIYLLIQDIKNLVAATKGSIQFAFMSELGKLDDTQREMLSIAENAIDQQLQLTNELIDLASLEAGTIKLTKESCDIAALLNDVLDQMHASAGGKGLKLHTQIASEIPPLLLDKRKIHQVLLTFLTNAINFTPESGTVAVGAMQEQVVNEYGKVLGNLVHVSVTDAGPVLTKEEIAVVLDRYEQARLGQTSRYRGLGLTICKNIILAHNGNIWVESGEGKGATFHFTIPL